MKENAVERVIKKDDDIERIVKEFAGARPAINRTEEILLDFMRNNLKEGDVVKYAEKGPDENQEENKKKKYSRTGNCFVWIILILVGIIGIGLVFVTL